MKLSIVMHVYNESQTIREVISNVVNAIEKSSMVQDYELIIIDDCSNDGTVDLLKCHFLNKNKIIIKFKDKNTGKGSALREGFKIARGDVVVIQDADLEYDPNDYEKLIGPIAKGKADVVYGSRFKGETARVLYYYHYLGNFTLTFLSNLFTNLNLTDMETCYKVFKLDIIKNMKLTSNRFGIEPEMTAKISKLRNVRIYEVPISYYGRTYDEGKKIGWRDGVAAFWFIIKYNLFTNIASSYTNVDGDIKKYCVAKL